MSLPLTSACIYSFSSSFTCPLSSFPPLLFLASPTPEDPFSLATKSFSTFSTFRSFLSHQSIPQPPRQITTHAFPLFIVNPYSLNLSSQELFPPSVWVVPAPSLLFSQSVALVFYLSPSAPVELPSLYRSVFFLHRWSIPNTFFFPHLPAILSGPKRCSLALLHKARLLRFLQRPCDDS